jgi:RNA polymerase sigma-70 factor (ECF subfamily)
MNSQAEEACKPVQWNVQTRESLLRRVRDWSDDESWQEFFQLYWRLIYTLAVQAGLNEAEAEDVVQATMLAVADNIRRFHYDREVGSFKSWLCHQAQWKIRDQLRKRRREEGHLARRSNPSTSPRTDTLARVPAIRDSLEELIEKDWEQAVATVALARVKAKVKPKHFQMFDLYAIKKWPIRRVSRTLQVNVAQVYLAKSRIMRLLKKQSLQVEAQLLHSLQQTPKPKTDL